MYRNFDFVVMLMFVKIKCKRVTAIQPLISIISIVIIEYIYTYYIYIGKYKVFELRTIIFMSL